MLKEVLTLRQYVYVSFQHEVIFKMVPLHIFEFFTTDFIICYIHTQVNTLLRRIEELKKLFILFTTCWMFSVQLLLFIQAESHSESHLEINILTNRTSQTILKTHLNPYWRLDKSTTKYFILTSNIDRSMLIQF